MPKSESTSKCLQTRKLNLIFKFITAVFIPMLLGLFTIILALQQQSIATTNREMDLHVATNQRRQNLELAIDEQRNGQFIAYMREISDLLLVNNFSLNKQILIAIVRPKTLAVLRQLDVIRKGYLVRYLHESRLISKMNPPYLSLILPGCLTVPWLLETSSPLDRTNQYQYLSQSANSHKQAYTVNVNIIMGLNVTCRHVYSSIETK
jgi:hypothetical protein